MLYIRRFLVFVLWLLISQQQVCAQESAPKPAQSIQLQNIGHKAERFQKRLLKNDEKYLLRLNRMERQLKKELQRKGSVTAKSIFDNTDQHYKVLVEKLKKPVDRSRNLPNTYNNHLDSVVTALAFLKKQKALPDKEVEAALSKYSKLQEAMYKSEEVKGAVQLRKQSLLSQLQPHGLGKKFRKFQKAAYYHKAQVEEFRKLINTSSGKEQMLLRAVNKMPAFKQYFRKNSELARLFVLSDNPNMNKPGLQTLKTVQQDFQQRYGAQAELEKVIGQSLQQAQRELTKLKNQLASGIDPEAAAIPGFKPNTQKTKPFLKRLELGSNFQTLRYNRHFPVTSDIGLSIGYKAHDRFQLGVGGSFKVGWGKSFKEIHISGQGYELRSFMDYHMKRNLWLTAGAEWSYLTKLPAEQQTLVRYDAWQKAALIGLTKKYKINARFNGNMQLLFNLLYRQQKPEKQPVILRFGYFLNQK